MVVRLMFVIQMLIILSAATQSFLKAHSESTGRRWGYWFSQERSSHSNGQFTTKNLITGVDCAHSSWASQRIQHVEDNSCGFIDSETQSTLSEEGHHNEVVCPDSHPWLAGWRCDGNRCNDKLVHCQKRDCQNSQVGEYWTEWFSNESDPMSCDENYYVIGLSCRGRDWDDMRLKCAKKWTSFPCRRWGYWFSEERSSHSDGQFTTQNLITGVDCDHSSCDSQRIQHVEDNSCGFIDSKTVGRLSEESHHNNVVCPDSHPWLAGWRCEGRRCNDKIVHCQKRDCEVKYGVQDQYWAPWFSNESGPESCRENYYVMGLKCRGDDWDDMRLRCAKKWTSFPCRGHKITNKPQKCDYSGEVGYCRIRSEYLMSGIVCDIGYGGCGSSMWASHSKTLCPAKTELELDMNQKLLSYEESNETIKQSECPEGQWLAGWQCYDRNCAERRLYCMERNGCIPSHKSTRKWTQPLITKDVGRKDWEEGSYGIGLRCESKDCQSISIRCARPTLP